MDLKRITNVNSLGVGRWGGRAERKVKYGQRREFTHPRYDEPAVAISNSYSQGQARGVTVVASQPHQSPNFKPAIISINKLIYRSSGFSSPFP